MNKELISEWAKVDMFKMGYTANSVDSSGNRSFIYVPESSDAEPLIQNVNIGWKFSTEHRVRYGMRFIKVKRFGKTRRYYVSKFMMTTARILNDKWMINLKG